MSIPLSRRRFIAGTGAILLGACSSNSESAVPPGTQTNTPGPSISTAGAITGSSTAPVAPAGTIRVLLPANSILDSTFVRTADVLGRSIDTEVYADVAFVADRLVQQQGDFQYDVVIAPSVFVPGAIEKGLLQEIDAAFVPSAARLVAGARGRAWDPDDRYTVCKELGFTGYAWDRQVLPDGIDSWASFVEAAASEAVGGRTTLLREGVEAISTIYWANGSRIATDLEPDRALTDLREFVESFVLDLDSFPSARMLEGSVALAQMWNGEGRSLVLSDPDRWGYAVGGPVTGGWMESFMIPAEAPNAADAHRFIELMLDPEISARQSVERGYFTGLESVIDAIADEPRADLIIVGPDGTGADGDLPEVLADVDPELVRQAVIVEPPGSSAPATTAAATTTTAAAVEATRPAPTTVPPPVTIPDERRVLRAQDENDDVARMQRRLTEVGFSVGPADGQYGDVTLAAVLAFQRSQGLQTDGVVGAYTWAALDSPTPIVATPRTSTPTRGTPAGSPSDVASGTTAVASGGDGRWVKAVIHLDSFTDDFYDAAGNLVATFPNSPGVNGLTPTGTFQVYSRSADTYYSKNPAETMKWMVRFNGGVGFHGIPRINGVPETTPLGQAPSSHGCIRHADDVAKRIYDHLVDGATVIVQHG